MALPKDLKKILAEIEGEGFKVVYPSGRGNQHIKVYAPDGTWVTNFPQTPGNDAKRSILNSLAPLKRARAKWSAQQ